MLPTVRKNITTAHEMRNSATERVTSSAGIENQLCCNPSTSAA
jgi:hypothetical protein